MAALIILGNERVNASDFPPATYSSLSAYFPVPAALGGVATGGFALSRVASGAGGHCQIVPPC